MAIRFIVGRGDNRHVVEMEQQGKPMHEQRRAFKHYLGLIRVPGQK